MDVNLEVPSGFDSDNRVGNGAASKTDETLIEKIGPNSGKEAAGEDLMVEVLGSDVLFDGVSAGNSKIGKEGGGAGLGKGEEVGELGHSNIRQVDGEGDGKSSMYVNEPGASQSHVTVKVVAHMFHKKPTTDNTSETLEDIDVDIDDSGHVSAVVPSRLGDASGGSFGTAVDKLENEGQTAFEGFGGSHSEVAESELDVKMEKVHVHQDSTSEELVPGISVASLYSPRDSGTVKTTGSESEDEEVDIGGHEPNIFTNQKLVTNEAMRSVPKEKNFHASYQLPAEKEGSFSVPDMVWGKVRSHPWWPGQIFHPSDASEIATKHHKKDCYLVAFFGDRTFAWSEASQLKHFRAHFAHVEKSSNSDDVHHAISCALEEVSRRVELGLSCHCLPHDMYEKLRYQNVESTGIREEASRRDGIDESSSAYSFQPHSFLQFIKSLAWAPSDGADQLDIVIGKAQLLAFYRLKGYNHLPEYQFTEWSSTNELETLTGASFAEDGQPVENQVDSLLKKKYKMGDIVYTSKRDRSMAELMDESMLLMGKDDDDDDETILGSLGSPTSTKKQKAGEFSHEESGGQSNVQNTISSMAPKQSFKIGDCILRAASQLTSSPGPPSFLKSINEKALKVNENDGASYDVPAQHENSTINSSGSVADDMLSQLQSVARDPKKGHDSINNLTSFFSTVRNNTLSPDKAVDSRKRKAPRSVMGSPETFEFEDMKDSYWTDRVIQNGGEEKPERKERKLNYQTVNLEPPASLSRSPRVHFRRRYSNGNPKIPLEQPASAVDKSRHAMLPAELILNFPDMNSIPSESKLNNMFRRFGPLKEFETEVDRENNRARVVFKRSSDAEVAYSSSQKFNIFGSTIVRYELSYSPSVSYKANKITATQGIETSVTLTELEYAPTHDLEFITMQELEDATMQDLQYPHAHDLEGVTMHDLEFTTNHDSEFPGPQDLDIVPTQLPEVTTIQSLDSSATEKQPTVEELSELPSSGDLAPQAEETVMDVNVSEVPSSGNLKPNAEETVTGGSGLASEDQHMEIATDDDHQGGLASEDRHMEIATDEDHQGGLASEDQHMEIATDEDHQGGLASEDQHMEIATDEDHKGGFASEDQQMEIATDEDPGVHMTEALASGGIQEAEAVVCDIKLDAVHHTEPVQNPESAASPDRVNTAGAKAAEVSAQGAVTSCGQEIDSITTRDADTLTIGEKEIVKDQDSVSLELHRQDEDSTENHTKDIIGSHDPEIVTGEAMLLSNQNAEQETDRENDVTLSNQSVEQETKQENDRMTAQENEVSLSLRKNAPDEDELLAPDVVRKQGPVESDTTEDFATAVSKDLGSQTLGGISNAVTLDIVAKEIGTVGDSGAAVNQDTDQDEDMEDEVSPDTDLKCRPVNVEISGPQELEDQTEERSMVSIVEVEPSSSLQNDDITNQENEKEKIVRSQDSEEDEQKAVDSNSLDDQQQAT